MYSNPIIHLTVISNMNIIQQLNQIEIKLDEILKQIPTNIPNNHYEVTAIENLEKAVDCVYVAKSQLYRKESSNQI